MLIAVFLCTLTSAILADDLDCTEAGGVCRRYNEACTIEVSGYCGWWFGSRRCCSSTLGSWQQWSQWSNCHLTGKSNRTRSCGGPGQCLGNAKETRSCVPNTPCPGMNMASRGTVKTHSPFNATADATVIRRTLAGNDTDWNAVIAVSGGRSASQRLAIARSYSLMSGKKSVWSTISQVLSEHGHLETMLKAIWDPRLFDAYSLMRAMKGLGTDEETLIEILVARSNAEIQEITTRYKSETGRELVTDIKRDTSGDFEDLLVSLLNIERDERSSVNRVKARSDAQALYRAGVGNWLGTDEDTFINIFSSRRFAQLQQIFCEYKTITGEDIIDSINSEFSGNIEKALKIITEIARNPHVYFSRRLYEAMDAFGTDDVLLIRIVLSRSEIDMKNIKDEFLSTYRESLASWIKGDTSGLYRKLLLLMIGEK